MITNQPVAMTEHERESDGIEENTAEAGIDDAFHQNVYGLTGAAETGLQHGESNLHAEYQERRARIKAQIRTVMSAETTQKASKGRS